MHLIMCLLVIFSLFSVMWVNPQEYIPVMKQQMNHQIFIFEALSLIIYKK